MAFQFVNRGYWVFKWMEGDKPRFLKKIEKPEDVDTVVREYVDKFIEYYMDTENIGVLLYSEEPDLVEVKSVKKIKPNELMIEYVYRDDEKEKPARCFFRVNVNENKMWILDDDLGGLIDNFRISGIPISRIDKVYAIESYIYWKKRGEEIPGDEVIKEYLIVVRAM